ncbi:MAG: aldo/keto reductase [Deltaproteobacteria bacterium]|nr:aldo/keto reductase [Deltaproteobacteria bacterium]
MKYRQLGKTNYQVSEIGYGTWAMGFMWGPRRDEEAITSLRYAWDSGLNFVDTAYLYGNGHSERLIAEAKESSDQKNSLIIATKCPPKTRAWPPQPGTSFCEAFPLDYLLETTEKSRQNLKVDQIDIQQLHVWLPEWLEQEEFPQAIEELKKRGLIKHFGVSLNDHDPNSGLALVQSGLVDSIQVIFNLFDQTPRKRLFPLCQENGVGVIVRVPLDEGGLTGTLTPQTQFVKSDWRRHYFKEGRLKETCEHAAQFDFLIQPSMQSLAQAALKFCLSEAAVSTVIVGMRSVDHVKQNLAVSELSDFTKEELDKAYSLEWPRNYYPTFS